MDERCVIGSRASRPCIEGIKGAYVQNRPDAFGQICFVTGEAEECDVGVVSREKWQKHKLTLCRSNNQSKIPEILGTFFTRQWIAALFISVGILLLLGNNRRNSWSREEFIRMWTCWKGSQDRDQLLEFEKL